ncbi:hypothetical protein [Deinococcus irradiatisoli]|uniref:hypothetical protein n=1 Tax=Deinococcus irradiatisoli TaxID=2202254 RepID=UPI0015E848FC|nr:hypothetical protein [Deinococcus irradiatisoli]
MTRPEDQDQPEVSAPQPSGDEGRKTATVSDEDVQEDGSGKHGRPSDDSDPGHS